MKIQFHKNPWDLYIILAYTEIVTAIIISRGTGSLGAFLLAIFCPGYVTTAALFPENAGLNWIERLAVSFGMSVVVVPFLGLLVWISGLGLGLLPILVFLAGYTNIVGTVAYARRQSLPIHRRLSFEFEFGKEAWEQQSFMDKALTFLTVASLVLAIGVLVSVTTAPKPTDHFTEFLIFGTPGNTDKNPTRLNVSQPGTVNLRIVNHEGSIGHYEVRVDLVGLRMVYNSTAKANETFEKNRTTLTWINTTIEDSHDWMQDFVFSIPASGFWKVNFLLYKVGELASPYRELGLYVLVGGG